MLDFFVTTALLHTEETFCSGVFCTVSACQDKINFDICDGEFYQFTLWSIVLHVDVAADNICKISDVAPDCHLFIEFSCSNVLRDFIVFFHNTAALVVYHDRMHTGRHCAMKKSFSAECFRRTVLERICEEETRDEQQSRSYFLHEFALFWGEQNRRECEHASTDLDWRKEVDLYIIATQILMILMSCIVELLHVMHADAEEPSPNTSTQRSPSLALKALL